MSELDEAFYRVARAGYRVNNLFERDDGDWQANVRAPDGKTFEFGVHRSPAGALHMAMSFAHKHELAWFKILTAVELSARTLRTINEALGARYAEPK